MRIATLLALFVLGFTVSVTAAQPKSKPPQLDLKGKTLQQVFEELLPGMGAKEIAARHGPQQKWQAICYVAGAPGNDKLRLEVCKLMAGKLDPATPIPARIWLLKQLEFLGRDESALPIAALLKDKDELVHDAAVRALANNPAPQATTLLIEAMRSADGKGKIGLINALGFRADKTSVDALAAELPKADEKAVVAVAKALGKIGTVEAGKVLKEQFDKLKANDERRFWLADALLVCADRRLQEGNKAEASSTYRFFYEESKLPRSIRLAALQGMLKTAGDDAGQMILDIIAGKEADSRAIALGQIEGISPAALKVLAANIGKLPPDGRVMLLGALAVRGDKAHMPLALTAVKEEKNDGVQRAGMLALGRLGDASVVPLLLETTLGKSKLSSAARESLIAMTAEGVNERIVDALKTAKDPASKVALINVLESRRTAAAVPVLLGDAVGDNAQVRAAAVTALRRLAGPDHLPALSRVYLMTPKGGERDEVERTVLAVCEKIPEAAKRADAVLEASEDPGDNIKLLPLLGRLGGPRILKLTKTALDASSAASREAAVLALHNWPDPSVSPLLLKIVDTPKNQDERSLAFRGLVRVNSLTSDTPAPARFDMLKKAMALAENDDEKRMVLIGMGNVRDLTTFNFVLPYLDDKNLVQAACRAVVDLAHSHNLRDPNMAAFTKALDRVIAICKDKELIQRAKNYKAGY